MSQNAGFGSDHDDSRDEEKVLGKSPTELVLCFISCPQDAARNFVGAILVTDASGRPLEFAFVEPVRPSQMQRILYGKTLEEHVRIDVIANKLLQGNSNVPDVIFVDADELLPMRRIVQIPVARLSKSDNSGTDSTKLSTLTYSTGGRRDDEELVGQVIGHLEPLIDLIEPFNRITEALKESGRAQGKPS